jgi:hypothetical protein
MIRVWPGLLAPAVHSTRKRRSASRGLDSWFAGGLSSAAATGRAGHAVASAAPSSVTATISDRHELIGSPPVPWAATGSTVAAAAVETAPTADGRTGHFRTSLRCSATVFFVLCAARPTSSATSTRAACRPAHPCPLPCDGRVRPPGRPALVFWQEGDSERTAPGPSTVSGPR